MSHLNTVPIFGFLLISSIFIAIASAATFTVKNNCPNTVWAAAVPGGGKQMATGDTWIVTAQPGQTGARIWARTGCTPSGSGLQCQTGDCGGVLQCTGYGTPPNTLAEYALDQFGNKDFFDISLVDGFNVPMTFLPVDNGCTVGPTCRADVNAQCPSQLKAANGGCNNPCTVFKTDEYCCNSGSCSPTNYSMYFKNLCPTAYSYPKDDATSTFTCPTGTNYAVTFCP